MWTVRIDGNPTIKCRNETAGINAYQSAQHWQTTGHEVELYCSTRRILPATESPRR